MIIFSKNYLLIKLVQRGQTTKNIYNCRRYGAVEGGRFCFEGGTRCGKGEGLHVFRVDNAEDIQISFDLASKGKLENKKRAGSSGFASKLIYFQNCLISGETSVTSLFLQRVWP